MDVSKIINNIDQIIKPLSNDTRVKLLIILKEGPVTYSDLLEQLNLESGSFYWHIKKMSLLVDQTEDKRYYLSDLGRKALDLLISDGAQTPIQFTPDWYLTLRSRLQSLFNAPVWLLLQQFLIIIILITFFYQSIDLIQFGTMVQQADNTFLNTMMSILVSLGLVNLLILITIKFHPGSKETDFQGWTIVYLQLMIASLPLLIVGTTIGFLIFLGAQFAFHPILQFIGALISIFLATLSTIGLIDNRYEFGFVNSSFMVLLIYYPYTLLSFLLVK